MVALGEEEEESSPGSELESGASACKVGHHKSASVPTRTPWLGLEGSSRAVG
jgi:hypothetical protein